VRNLQGLCSPPALSWRDKRGVPFVAVSSDFRSDASNTMIVSPWAHHRAAHMPMPMGPFVSRLNSRPDRSRAGPGAIGWQWSGQWLPQLGTMSTSLELANVTHRSYAAAKQQLTTPTIPRGFIVMHFPQVWHSLLSKHFCPSHPCQDEIAMFITRGRVSTRLATKHTSCFSEETP
jgi:hypothetical protein